MTDPIYPESIHGAWFLNKKEGAAASTLAMTDCELLVFRRDGTFSRHQIKPNQTREVEHGEHTFDGEFLITRGRNTETYRVKLVDPTHWALETKKQTVHVYRHVGAAPFALSDDIARSIRILPMRAKGADWVEGATLVQPIEYADSDGQRTTIGLASVELQTNQNTCWIGIQRLATGLDDSTWQRIARESLFDIGLDDTDHITTLAITFYDDPSADLIIPLDA